MPIDDRTTNRSYQLPNADNQAADDVARLRAALVAIDADIFTRYTKTETDALINNLIAAAPGALNTLQELAAAMGDDPNFAATVATVLGQKANIIDVYSKAESDAGAGAPADGAVTPAKLAQPFTRTAEANATGGAIDFIGIPIWVTRITVAFNQVSTNGSSLVICRVGASSIVTTGYTSICTLDQLIATETSGFIASANNTSFDRRVGSLTLHKCGSTNWVLSGVVGATGAASSNTSTACGSIQLGGALDRVRVTTINGTDAFDNGTITLFYE